MNTTRQSAFALLCAAFTALSATGPAAAQRIGFNFNDGLQGWTQIYPVSGILWENGALGAYHDGWNTEEPGKNDFTTFGRSPAFYITDSGAMTFQLAGGESPLAEPVGPEQIPEFAILAGGFAGVALRDVADNTYVLSRRKSGNGGEWQNNQFSASELAPFIDDGRQYTLDYIDYNRGGWGWTYLDNVSIPGVYIEPEAPANLQATAGATSATLTWDAPFGTDSYSIRRSTTSGSDYEEVGTSPSPSFTDQNLTPETSYYYVVVASNASGSGPASAEASVTPAGGTPSSASSIASFTFGNAGDAKITGTAISKFLRAGTDLNLAPTLVLSPFAKADPPSGTVRNFATPQNYTITAEDGSTTVFTVTVNLVNHLDYDFNNGLQGWEQIFPVAGILWENGRLGAYHDGWDEGINDFTTFGRSPGFYLVDSGPLTFQLEGGQSPLAAPHVGPSEIPEFAILAGGFAGVALREVETDTYVLSRRRTDNGGWQNNQFSQAELAPFINNGKQYTLDYIDYNRGGWGWTYLDNVSIPGVSAEPGTEALLTSIQITPGNHVEFFGNDIEIVVPYGTDLSSTIVPLISVSPEAQISPPNGTALDFSEPVVFTVTSGDGLVVEEFTVTASIGGLMTVKTYQDIFGDSMLAPISNLLFQTPTGSGDHFGNILYGDGRFPGFASSLPGLSRNDEFSVIWEGWLDVTKDGHGFYTFGTNSDDGSMIYFDLDGDGSFDGPGELIVSNNGIGPMRIRTGTVNLQMDSVRVLIGYYEAAGGEGMEARFAKGEDLPFGALAPIGGISGHFLPEQPAANPASAGLWYLTAENRAAVATDADSLLLGVPPGSDLTALDPEFMISPGATAVPPSGTLRDFSTPQTYTVTSEDGTTTRTYTVTAFVSLSYDFNDGTLQGWNNRVWNLAANGGSGGWSDLPPNDTFLGSINGGVIQPPSEANGLFVPANGAVWVSGNTDWHANTLWLRSPAFFLSSAADLTVDLAQGTSRAAEDPTNESQIPFTAIEGAGWKGVALRRVSDGAFLLAKPRTGENGPARTVRFTAEELAPFHGTACTLELINYNRGGWGWIVMDNVNIPSLGLVPGSPYENWISDNYPWITGASAAADADADQDGRSNFEEFAFNTDPSDPAGGPIVIGPGGGISANGQPFVDPTGRAIIFGRRADHASTGLVYTVQLSADLAHWVNHDGIPEVLASDDQMEAVRVAYPATISTPGGPQAPNFARVHVTMAD